MEKLPCGPSTLPAIAIVGIAAQLPSGMHSTSNLDHRTFHEFLLQQNESYETIPASRFNANSWKGRGLGRIVTDKGSFLKDIDLFDHVEFGVSSKDAQSMAVSTRKLLELSFLALLDSGIDYRGKDVGCYMSAVDFDMMNIAEPDEYEARGSFAGIPCMVANRVSYHLDLLGPSIPLDTACSASLTAMHLAVQALRSGDCSAAIVGGCQLNHRLVDWMSYSQGSLLAPDGKCKPFDESADGFARGEGAAVVVVKLLEDAIRDGDHVYASILGTGINSSGSAASISAPVAEAQKDAMLKAYARTGRSPAEVDFVEVHATGTAAGDPTEANWVGEQFKRNGELLIGSVKGNIGHLEITAFLASLTKVCSIFRTGVVPPNANFLRRNPAIRWDEYHLRVPVSPTPIRPCSQSGKLLISIASSGIGGANGHAVLEAHVSTPETIVTGFDSPVLMIAGGLTPRSSAAIADELKELLKSEDSKDHLSSLAVVMGRRARQMTWRAAAVLCPGEEEKFAFPTPLLAPRKTPPVAFVFSGQGPQHLQMGCQLYTRYTAFRRSVDLSDVIYQRITGESLITTHGLFGGAASTELPQIWPIAITLPAIAVVHVALVDLLRSVNVVPDIVFGHSAGETAMLYSSCSASREMVVELAIARGRALSVVEKSGGSMAAISCTIQEARAIVDYATRGCPEQKLDIGCFNAHDAVTLSGSERCIERAVEYAKSLGLFAVKLRTGTPIHSSLVDACRSSYSRLVKQVFDDHGGDFLPTTTTYSTLTGDRWKDSFTSEYFWETARKPVKFMQAMMAAIRDHPNAIFIELSPHPVLASYMTSLGAQSGGVLCPMRRHKSLGRYDETKTFLETIGKLVVSGLNDIDFASLYGIKSVDVTRVEIPKYPFAHKRIPYYPESSAMIDRQFSRRRGSLSGPNLKVNASTHPVLAQHIIKGEPIMPAAGYLEMAFELGAKRLWNVQFHAMLSLSPTKPTPIYIELDELHWTVKSEYGPDKVRLNASGYLSLGAEDVGPPRLDVNSVQMRSKRVDIAGFYRGLEYFASYGSAYQRIQALYEGEEEFLVQIRGLVDDLDEDEGYVIHPAILDSAIHIGVHKMATGSADDNIYYLPSHVDTIIIHDLLKEGVPETLFVHALFRRWLPDSLTFDFYLTNSVGDLLLTLRGFEVAKHRSESNTSIERRYDVVREPLIGLSIPITPDNSGPKSLFTVQYVRGHEMDIKAKLSELDRESPTQVWITATTGPDGAAARGFSRSLRREVDSWDIRLVIFPEHCSSEKRTSVLQYLAETNALEHEFVMEATGSVYTERFEESAAPEIQVRDMKYNSRWEIDASGNTTYSALPTVPTGFLLVRIRHVSSCEAGLRGFVGEVESGSNAGSTVMGVSDEPLSNYTVVHEGWTMLVDGYEQNLEILPSIALGAVVAELALGSAVLSQPSRAITYQLLIASEGGVMSASLSYILLLLGIQYENIQALTPEHAEMIAEKNTVISSFVDKKDVQLIKSAMRPYSKLFLWNDENDGVHAKIKEDVWLPAGAIANVRALEDGLNAVTRSETQIIHSIFDPSKTYLLIGGVGSLGMQISLWMYQKGARNLVLTSRGGRSSAAFTRNKTSTRILHYLESLTDLNIRLESCDARSVPATKSLLETIEHPIGGCILLSAMVSDRSFFAQTADSFAVPFEGKRVPFKTLESVLNIGELDFFITFSSIAGCGNAGQTNYAAANTELDELSRPYPNSFSFVCPLILDSSMAMIGSASSKLNHLEPWAVTSEKLLAYLEDGIMKLMSGPFNLYVPDLDWSKVHKHLGSSFLYDHLVKETNELEENKIVMGEIPAESMGRIVRERLGISADDFSPSVPLTSYGLDSLSAAQISSAFKPFIRVSQLQLLANLCLNDLTARLASLETQAPEEQSQGNDVGSFDWAEMHKAGQSLVKLRDVPGNPLILLHGANGTLLSFKTLQDRLKSALWAIQTTPDTPLDSVKSTAIFYYEKIKEERGAGPYRIGSFSGSSVIALQLAMLFEAQGDVVEQLILIEHFPLLVSSPIYSYDSASIESGIPSRALLRQVLENMTELYRMDRNPAGHRIADEYLSVFDEESGADNISEYSKYSIGIFKAIASASLKFMFELTGPDMSVLRERVSAWIQLVKTRPTVYVASDGFLKTIPLDVRREWWDLGAHLCLTNPEVKLIIAGHFSILESEELIQYLDDKAFLAEEVQS